MTFCGFDVYGKSRTMGYCVVYDISQGLFCIKLSIMERQSVLLRVKYIHNIFLLLLRESYYHKFYGWYCNNKDTSKPRKIEFPMIIGHYVSWWDWASTIWNNIYIGYDLTTVAWEWYLNGWIAGDI